MPLYMYQASYTAESLAAQIREPKDRIEAVRAAFDAIGAKVLAAGDPFAEYDVLAVFEAPNDTAVASLAVAIGAAVQSSPPRRLDCSVPKSGSSRSRERSR